MQLELPPGFAIWTAVGPVPLLLFGLDGRLSRVEGAVLVAWSVVALVGLARSGSALLADENGERVRSPGVRLLAGLVVLTGGGWLLGQGLTSTVTQPWHLADAACNTAVAVSVEAEDVARVAVPARRGRPELGLGNIGATVVHFAALNAGVLALVKPLPLGARHHALLPPRRGGKPSDSCCAAADPQAARTDRRRRVDRPLRRLRRHRDRHLDVTSAGVVLNEAGAADLQ